MSNYTKVCPKCQVEKPLTVEFFHKRSSRKSGFHSHCKLCRNEYNEVYQEINSASGKTAEYSKEYYDKNRSSRIAYSRQNYQDNIELKRKKAIENRRKHVERYREYNRVYQNKHKVNRSIRSGLYGCLMGRRKKSKSFNYIGLTPPEFKDYLESKFQPGMTWENYGNPNGDHTECWHIDHIRPLASFDFPSLNGEELEGALHEAWHHSNLQPLWGKENLSKGNKF